MAHQDDGIMLSEGVENRMVPDGVVNVMNPHLGMFSTNDTQSKAATKDENGSAGIFVQKSGSRKMFMSAGRLVLPRFTGFGQKNRPLEEPPPQEAATLEQHIAVDKQEPVFITRSDIDQESKLSEQDIVTCSECGIAQERQKDIEFQCLRCQTKLAERRSHDMMLSSELSKELPTLEEGCDDVSEHEDDNGVGRIVRTIQEGDEYMAEQPLDSALQHQEEKPRRRLSSFMRRLSNNLRGSSASSASSSSSSMNDHGSSYLQEADQMYDPVLNTVNSTDVSMENNNPAHVGPAGPLASDSI